MFRRTPLTGPPMSALGQKQTYAVQNVMSALPPIATAKADIRKRSCLLYPQKQTCAAHSLMSALGQKRTSPLHSIISSARARNEGDRLRPSAFAVLTLITNMNFDDTPTGRSLGLAPFRI